MRKRLQPGGFDVLPAIGTHAVGPGGDLPQGQLDLALSQAMNHHDPPPGMSDLNTVVTHEQPRDYPLWDDRPFAPGTYYVRIGCASADGTATVIVESGSEQRTLSAQCAATTGCGRRGSSPAGLPRPATR